MLTLELGARHAATRVHHTYWRRGGVAARGGRAATSISTIVGLQPTLSAFPTQWPSSSLLHRTSSWPVQQKRWQPARRRQARYQLYSSRCPTRLVRVLSPA